MGPALENDYDSDPHRFAAAQLATRRFLSGDDTHADVARRFVAERVRSVVDIGGGNGTLARLLTESKIATVVVDRSNHVARAPRPAVQADGRQLPFRNNTFDGAAALWMLYHLDDPLIALREAHRVLRVGGSLAICVPSRYNDPELAAVTPRWGQPLSFDAENGPGLIGQVFHEVEFHHWDAPLIHLPDHDAVELYLRGRGFTDEGARAASRNVATPLTLTKRGMVCWARKTAV